MDIFRYIVRFLYKIRWYLVILPLIAMIVAWFSTRNMERVYDANTTIYTGMITGYNIEGGTGTAGGNQQTNIINLMLIIQTDNTIHEVALRLFAQLYHSRAFPSIGCQCPSRGEGTHQSQQRARDLSKPKSIRKTNSGQFSVWLIKLSPVFWN